MSLTQIGAGGLLAGLALLAGAVFLLQRLRVRRDELVVPTTLFWLEAQKESQARKLTERFRSPLVFALLFAIVSLLWIAFAGPKSESKNHPSTIVFVDASAAMQREAAGGGTRLDAALLRAEALLGKLPRASRSLVLAGENTVTLLGPGEALELLAERREQLASGTLPAGPATALRDAIGTLIEARSLSQAAPAPEAMPLSSRAWKPGSDATVVAIGAPASLEALKALSTGEQLQLETLVIPSSEAPNEGILVFGAAPAESGLANAADLYIETTGKTPRLTLTSEEGASQVITLESPAPGQFFARDITLDGALATASLDAAGDGLAADNQATLRLADRGVLAVHVAPDVPPAWQAALEAAIAADTGLALAPAEDADVVVQTGSAATSLPALCLMGPMSSLSGTPSIDVEAPPGAPSFSEWADALALNPLGTGLLNPGVRAKGSEDPPPRLAFFNAPTSGPARLKVPAGLIVPPYELVETRTFPLFISSAVRWLASSKGAATDLRSLTSRDLVGRAVTLEAPATAPPASLELAAAPGSSKLWPALVLLALGLLAFEWYLTSTRRIP